MQMTIVEPTQRLGLALVTILSAAEDFDKDRQEVLDRLDACIAPRKQLHELEWELRKRSEEVRELQRVRQPRGPFLAAFMDAISPAELDMSFRAVPGFLKL